MTAFLIVGIVTAVYADGQSDTAESIASAPQRIVVFPLFAEEMLLDMIGPGRIAYVGHAYFEHGEAYSPTMEQNRNIPGGFWQNSDEEAILALMPDLLILPDDLERDFAEVFPMLDKANIPVLFLKTPESIEDIADTLAIIGVAVGALEKAAAMIQTMDAALQAIAESVSGIPQDQRIRAVHWETIYGGEPGWVWFYEANAFSMIAQAAGVMNAGPDGTDAMEWSAALLAGWNPDLITFDPVRYDTDGSVYEISDRYIENRIAAILDSPDLSGVIAVQSQNVHSLRLSLSQYVVQSVLDLARLAYPDLFPES